MMPLTEHAVDVATDRLVSLDQKGYFSFAKSGLHVVDRIVTGFSEEEVEALGDNVVLILETVKEMTQPEIMQMMRTTATVMRHEDLPANVSMFTLLRQLNDPDVKRGLSKTLEVLKTFSDN